MTTSFVLIGGLVAFGLCGLVAWIYIYSVKAGYQPSAFEVRKIEGLGGLDDQIISEVAPQLAILPRGPDSCVVKERDSDDALYFILEGGVNIVKHGAVYSTLIKELKEGAFFGEMAFLTGAARIATAIVTRDAKLVRIKRGAYNRLAEFSPEFEAAVWDACDRHTISLFLADFEELRGIPTAARDNWIEGRSTEKLKAGEVLLPAHREWLAVVKGEVQVDQEVFRAPNLLRKPSRLEANTDVRLCWLDLAPSLLDEAAES